MGEQQNNTPVLPGPSKSRPLLVAGVIVGLVALIGAAGFFGYGIYKDYLKRQEMAAAVQVQTFYEGISVAGVPLGGMTMDEAFAAVEKQESAQRPAWEVTVKYGEKSWGASQDDLAFSYNTEEALKKAFGYAREGTLQERFAQVEALPASPKDFPLDVRVSYDALRKKAEQVALELDRPARDAEILSVSAAGDFSAREGQTGILVDRDALTNALSDAFENKTDEITVPVTETPFKLSAADLKKNMRPLGTFSTVSTNTANGNYNMKLAMAALNGTVVQPGETFSYFAVVGPANSAQGYRAAHAIIKGRLIDSIGGGICQTSTTLYGAALRANMEIVERSNHSIQSTYCPIGQDAAVSYSVPDFKFRNNSDYPVYIAAEMDGKTLSATFYGRQDPSYDRIEIVSQRTAFLPALEDKVTYVQDNKLAKDKFRLDAKPRGGARATASRVFYKGGTIVKTEALKPSYYPPAGWYYSYGPGSDLTKAPNSGAIAPPSAPPESESPGGGTAVGGATSTPPVASAPQEEIPSDPAQGDPENQPGE